jgi:hypothetical protein
VKSISCRLITLFFAIICAVVAALDLWPVGRFLTADQNHDGRPDIWRWYNDRGELVQVDVDSNFDGLPDIEEYYEHGALVRRDSDCNFNGQTDLVEEFNPETHQKTRSLVDIDNDGTADLLVLFQDGRPVFSARTSPNPSAAPPATAAATPQLGAARLLALNDPFQSDPAVRATHVAAGSTACVGLSTSELPRPRFATIEPAEAPTRVAARPTARPTQNQQLVRSSRAPPASSL